MQDLRVCSYPPGGTMGPHQHEDAHLTVVLAGCYQERIRGRATEHKPGCMLFYPAGETHSQVFGEAGSSALIFRPKLAWMELLTSEAVRLSEAPFVNIGTPRDLAGRLLRELRRQDAFAPLIVEGMLLELLAAFSRAYRDATREREPSMWLKARREVLEANCGAALTHQDLAGYVDRHPVHVARAFRQVYGETTGDFQRRRRMEKAASMLRMGPSSLTERLRWSAALPTMHTFPAAFGRFTGQRLRAIELSTIEGSPLAPPEQLAS